DRRLAKNHIRDANTHALELVRAAQASAGVVVVDYHARGMNSDFYPRYGPWIMEFVQKNLDSSVSFRTPRELAQEYNEYETRLEADSSDHAEVSCAAVQITPVRSAQSIYAYAAPSVSVGFLRPEESV